MDLCMIILLIVLVLSLFGLVNVLDKKEKHS